MAVKYASPRKWATNMSVDGPICQWTVQYVSVRSNMSVDGPICQWTPFPGEAARLPGPPRVPRAATRRARRAGRPAAPAHRRGAEEPSACPGCPPALTGERCDRDSDRAVKRPSRAVKRPSRAVKRPSRASDAADTAGPEHRRRKARECACRADPRPSRRRPAATWPVDTHTHARTHARTHAHTVWTTFDPS